MPVEICDAGRFAWTAANELAAEVGVRNAQATVLAPTGTIGLLMDCDTTGIEPDLGLCKMKKLVGGGTMMIVNQSVPRALRRLGYSDGQVEAITAYIDENKTILGAPGLDPGHTDGVRLLDGGQPHPLQRSREDDGCRAAVHLRRHLQDGQHARGCHGRRCGAAPHRRLAHGREGHRHLPRQLQGRPAAVDGQEGRRPSDEADQAVAEPVVETKIVYKPIRERLPRDRRSRTFEFRVADCKGYVTVGEYDDGRPGEVFLRVSKQGSTLAGIMDALAISLSHGLQYGVPLRTYVDTYTGMRFEPAGMTDDPDIRIASSIMDYLFRKLAVVYLSYEERIESRHLHHR